MPVPIDFERKTALWTNDNTAALKAFLNTQTGKLLIRQLYLNIMEIAFSPKAATPDVDGVRRGMLATVNEITRLADSDIGTLNG